MRRDLELNIWIFEIYWTLHVKKLNTFLQDELMHCMFTEFLQKSRFLDNFWLFSGLLQIKIAILKEAFCRSVGYFKKGEKFQFVAFRVWSAELIFFNFTLEKRINRGTFGGKNETGGCVTHLFWTNCHFLQSNYFVKT